MNYIKIKAWWIIITVTIKSWFKEKWKHFRFICHLRISELKKRVLSLESRLRYEKNPVRNRVTVVPSPVLEVMTCPGPQVKHFIPEDGPTSEAAMKQLDEAIKRDQLRVKEKVLSYKKGYAKNLAIELKTVLTEIKEAESKKKNGKKAS